MPEESVPKAKKKGGWFQKFPKEILFSPGGVIIVSLAFIIESASLLLPFPFNYLIGIPLQIYFLVLLRIVADYPLKAMVIPFLIECIPLINKIVPTWLLRLFI